MFKVISSRVLLAGEHSYGCLMIEFPASISKKVIDFGKNKIADKDVYTDKGEKGREDTIHVTVKYGIHTKDAAEVAKVVKDFGKFSIDLLEVSKFSNDDTEHDVLKVDIGGEKLHQLNKLVSTKLKCTDKHPTYRPHMTIAYIKKGTCSDLVGSKDLSNTKFEVNELVFNSSDDERTTIKIAR